MCMRPRRTLLAPGRFGLSSWIATSVSMRMTSATSIAQRRWMMVAGCPRLKRASCGKIQAVPRPSGTTNDAAKIEILVEMSAQRMTGALHLLRGAINALALLGQREPIEQAIEQAKFENRLQPLDAADDSRGAGAQCRCGFAEVERARDDHENAQVIPRDALKQRRNGLLHFCTVLFQ